MSDQGRLMDHEYDGIREYDNPTPGWWHMLLWGSIVFSICYVLFYHFSIFAPSIPTRWEAAQAADFERQFGDVGILEADADTLVKAMDSEIWMSIGEGIYTTNCQQCHGGLGEGQTGPNLTDDHYLNVQDIEGLFTVISDGVVANGMPAWGNRLGQNQRVLVAAYVASLRGSEVGGKAPEGDVIPPWPAPPAPDGDAEAAPAGD